MERTEPPKNVFSISAAAVASSSIPSKSVQEKNYKIQTKKKKMDNTEISDDTPCSSIAVDAVIRIGYAGLIWGVCSGPYNANKRGLTGIPRASFVAKSVGTYGFQFGLFAGIFSVTSCGLQRYRGEKGSMNALIAGAVAGAAVGAGTRNWKQVAGLASVLALSAAGDSKVI